jgi:Peptidase family M28
MRHKITFLLLLAAICCKAQTNDSAIISAIYKEALTQNQAYKWLEQLCTIAPKRLSGSPGAAKAVELVYNQLQSIKNISVYKQDVMVPHWVSGEKETAYITTGKVKTPLSVCALGRSIGTSAEGLKGSVIEVKDFEELDKLGEKVKGKIVFYNHPMNPGYYNTFRAYGEAVRYRWAGANRASNYGAIGVVVRSMTLAFDDFPHTGSMANYDSVPPIPACAISTIGAQKLSESLTKDNNLQFFYKASCKTLPDAPSHNVIGEIKGSEFPEEIIIVGGHLDAWETGDGAHDDGAGVVQAMDVLRLFKDLNIQPKRTIRCVAFMNEENGGRGGEKYAVESKEKKQNHIAAIESDGGGATPQGFSFKGDAAVVEKIMKWKDLLKPYGANDWTEGHGGADIDHLEDQGTLLIGLTPDSQRYFDYHHAASDTFDKVNKRELQLGAASMAAMVYLLSEYGVK